jgi:hypothetical protein
MQFDSTTIKVYNSVGTFSYNILKKGLGYYHKNSLRNTPRIYGFIHGLFNNDVAAILHYIKVKGKAIPLQAWTGPEGSRRLRIPDFKTIST